MTVRELIYYVPLFCGLFTPKEYYVKYIFFLFQNFAKFYKFQKMVAENNVFQNGLISK